jgi:hypothetical protein
LIKEKALEVQNSNIDFCWSYALNRKGTLNGEVAGLILKLKNENKRSNF